MPNAIVARPNVDLSAAKRTAEEPTVRLDNGKLTIQGTAGADNISVGKDASGNVVVKSGDQVLGTFPADQVKSVRVHGHAGADNIKVDVGQDIKVRVRGGRGGDSVEVDNAKDAFVIYDLVAVHHAVDQSGAEIYEIEPGRPVVLRRGRLANQDWF